jgi:hypothetical protein
VERGRVKLDYTGEQVREEPLGVVQEGAFALHAPKLLEERKRDDLRGREPFERLVAARAVVEQRVGVIHETEKHG